MFLCPQNAAKQAAAAATQTIAAAQNAAASNKNTAAHQQLVQSCKVRIGAVYCLFVFWYAVNEWNTFFPYLLLVSQLVFNAIVYCVHPTYLIYRTTVIENLYFDAFSPSWLYWSPCIYAYTVYTVHMCVFLCVKAVADHIPQLVQGVRGSQAKPEDLSAQLALIIASQNFLQVQNTHSQTSTLYRELG